MEKQIPNSCSQEICNSTEQHDGNALEKPYTSGKRSDRGRVSCNDQSPQIENDHPNKPGKRAKNNQKYTVHGMKSKEGQESGAVCQSQVCCLTYYRLE